MADKAGALAEAIHAAEQEGYRLESQDDSSAVLVRPIEPPVGRTILFVVSMFGGLILFLAAWFFFVIPITVLVLWWMDRRQKERIRLSIGPEGQIVREQVLPTRRGKRPS